MTTDNNQQAARELLPCPFCGGEPYENAIEPHTHSPFLKNLGIPDHGGSHVIECGCGAGLIDDTREAVIVRWNKRAGSRRGEWIEWFEEWGRQNDMNLHRVRDGRLLSPDSSIAERAYLSACMTSAIYYMELDRPTPPDSGENR